MAKKKKSTTKVRAKTKKVSAEVMRAITKTESGIWKKIHQKIDENKKMGVRPFVITVTEIDASGKEVERDITTALVRAVARATHFPKMGNGLSKLSQVKFCEDNAIPFVVRSEVTSKATNFRSDNAVRARLVSWKTNGIIQNGVTVVWASDARTALVDWNNGDTDSHEKVFIVRTK